MVNEKTISKKLKITDYVFTYNDEDLNNASIEYRFGEIEHTKPYYENGIKVKENEVWYTPIIDFTIRAEDKFENIFALDFMLEMDVDMLNKLPKKAININKHMVPGEIFFHNPYESGIEFLDSVYEEENIYHFCPSYWVQKGTNNKFTFKIQYQDIFIWFNIEFDNK